MVRRGRARRISRDREHHALSSPRTELQSPARAKGLFAGIDVSGGSLNPGTSKNERAYGANASARDIALGTTPVKMGAEAQVFTNALGRETRGTSGVK